MSGKRSPKHLKRGHKTIVLIQTSSYLSRYILSLSFPLAVASLSISLLPLAFLLACLLMWSTPQTKWRIGSGCLLGVQAWFEVAAEKLGTVWRNPHVHFDVKTMNRRCLPVVWCPPALLLHLNYYIFVAHVGFPYYWFLHTLGDAIKNNLS